MSETISKCKTNRIFWEWKKKRNVVLSRYTFLLFFPLEIAGYCCENSSFGPEHEIVEIEFGSCCIQPPFSTFPSASLHFFSATWRDGPEEIYAHQAPWHHPCFLSMLAACGPALGCVLSLSWEQVSRKRAWTPLGGLSMAEFPFQRALQHGQRLLQPGFADEFPDHHSSSLN